MTTTATTALSAANGNPGGSAATLREQLTRALPVTSELAVEGWGVTVQIRPMSVRAKSEIVGDEDMKPSQLVDFLPRIVIATTFDPTTGAALFDVGDLDWLRDQPAGVVEQVAMAGLRASGLTEDALAAAKKD